MIEEWREVVGFEGIYQVSSLGRVRSVDHVDSSGRPRKGKLHSQELVWTGYLRVPLKGKKIPVHRLVCQAFHPNPHNYPNVNHKSGVKGDNSSDNLEWVSKSQNTKHAYETGLLAKMYGEKNPMSKLSNEDREALCEELDKNPNEFLSRKYGIAISTVSGLRKKMGLGKYKGGDKITPEMREMLIKDLFKMSLKNLQIKYGVSRRYIDPLRKEMSLEENI